MAIEGGDVRLFNEANAGPSESSQLPGGDVLNDPIPVETTETDIPNNQNAGSRVVLFNDQNRDRDQLATIGLALGAVAVLAALTGG